MADKKLKVRIRNTDSIIFDGEADRISSYNEVGTFDIYRTHANFISIIRKELAVYNDHQKVKEMKFEQAVLKVKQDSVHIFLGIEVLQLEEQQTYTKISNAPGK